MNDLPPLHARHRTTPRIPASWRLLAAFWLLMLCMLLFDWNFGVLRGAMLIGFAGLALICLRRNGEALRISPAVLRALVGVLLAAHAVFFVVSALRGVPLSDIAVTTLSAAQDLVGGINPYTAPLDHSDSAIASHAFGYKYLPMMPLVYMPFGLTLAERGMLLTNFVLDLTTAATVFMLARRAADRVAALIAAALYLSLPLVLGQLYAKGVTDLVPVGFMLASMVALDSRPWLSGFLLGLSISSKLLPALGASPALVPARGRLAFALGVLAGVVPTAIAFVSAPQGFFDNIIGFNFQRPVTSMSWMAGMAPVAVKFARAGLGGTWILLAISALLFARHLATRCVLVVLLLLAVILAGQGAQQNYMLWWIPFLCVALAMKTGHRHCLRRH